MCEEEREDLLKEELEQDSNSKKNIKLILQYDGTNYYGWQVQKNAVTIQGILEEAIKRVTGEEVRVRASGRTDAGVHAFYQVANFKTTTTIPLDGLKCAINSILPDDIKIIHIEEAHAKFHPITAAGKCYLYRIITSDVMLPLFKRYAWVICNQLNLIKMIKATNYLIGQHDFKAFMATGSAVTTTIRDLMLIKIIEKKLDPFFPLPENAKEINIFLVANGFLRRMVRNIVGLLYKIAIDKLEPEIVIELLNEGRRTVNFPSAPSNGLFLFKVFYDKDELQNFVETLKEL